MWSKCDAMLWQKIFWNAIRLSGKTVIFLMVLRLSSHTLITLWLGSMPSFWLSLPVRVLLRPFRVCLCCRFWLSCCCPTIARCRHKRLWRLNKHNYVAQSGFCAFAVAALFARKLYSTHTHTHTKRWKKIKPKNSNFFKFRRYFFCHFAFVIGRLCRCRHSY